MKKIIPVLLFIALASISCEAQNNSNEKSLKVNEKKAKVTFVELGSVNCIPCKQMQPVMKSIEEKYGEKIDVVFYDVWTDAGKPCATKFGIKLIPTQVFLDADGKEFFRHEGFFPETEIDKVLKDHGLE